MQKMTFMLGVAVLGLGARAVCAEELTLVPMQGPMIHVNLGYRSDTSELYVHVETPVPQLVPLVLSNPGDWFHPADPWFSWLDPSAQGLPFNRQYGFVVDAESDLLPAETSIWIRQLNASPGLEAFQYRRNEPVGWDPMFGTAGSTNLFEWSLRMFHPAYVAPSQNRPLAADYEAFLVQTSDGSPVSGVAPVSFTLDWTVLVPALQWVAAEEGSMAVSWPVALTNFTLQAAPDLGGTSWQSVTNQPVAVDGTNTVILSPDQPAMFYRLYRAP